MITHLARTEYPLGEHAEKLLYFLKLIYPISLLMLGFFALGLWLAYLFWVKYAKRLHASYEENGAVIDRMTNLSDKQNALLASIEARFDEERNDWAAKVNDRDSELEILAGQLSEADLFAAKQKADLNAEITKIGDGLNAKIAKLDDELDGKSAELSDFDQKFSTAVGEKDEEIKQLGTEVSKTASLRKELAEMINIAADLRSELKGKSNLGDRLNELEGILADREVQVRDLREKLESRS